MLDLEFFISNADFECDDSVVSARMADRPPVSQIARTISALSGINQILKNVAHYNKNEKKFAYLTHTILLDFFS